MPCFIVRSIKTVYEIEFFKIIFIFKTSFFGNITRYCDVFISYTKIKKSFCCRILDGPITTILINFIACFLDNIESFRCIFLELNHKCCTDRCIKCCVCHKNYLLVLYNLLVCLWLYSTKEVF